MGIKAALLAFSDGELIPALRDAGPADAAAGLALAGQALPGYGLEPITQWSLDDARYPPRGHVYIGVMPRVTVLADQRLKFLRHSDLPSHLIDLAGGRRITSVRIDSISDFFAMSVWEEGTLVRSLSLNLDEVVEDIGSPLEFEAPFWAGEHAYAPVPVIPATSPPVVHQPGSFPFHPLELGERALHKLFGFAGIGGHRRGQPHDGPDTSRIHLQGYRAVDPASQEQAELERLTAMSRTMRQRSLKLGPGGALVEVPAG